MIDPEAAPDHVQTEHVYHEHIDSLGVVYHAEYLKFLERSRSAWLRQLGLSQRAWLDQGLGLVVHRISIDYVAPARLEQQLEMRLWLSRPVQGARLGFHQRIVLSESQRLLVRADVQVVALILRALRPTRLPADLLRRLEAP